MALLLSGKTRNSTTSTGFLSLGNAQAALGNTPSTSTGYTLISNNSQTSWVSSLGRVEFTYSNAVSYINTNIPNGDVVYRPNGTGKLYLYGPVIIPDLSATAKIKVTVRVATTSNVNLIGGAPYVVDGVTLQSGDDIIVKSQSNPKDNGIYTVSVLGVVPNSGTWVRQKDSATALSLSGTLAFVNEGTKNGGYYFYTDFKPTSTLAELPSLPGDPVNWYQVLTDSKPQTITAKNIDNSPIGVTTASTGNFTQGYFNTASISSLLTITGVTRIVNQTTATSTWTGALTIAGGLGVNGSLYARKVFIDGVPLENAYWNGGQISNPFYVANIEEAVNTMTGALKVLEGAGIGGALYVGKKIVVESPVQNHAVSLTMRNTAANGQGYTWEVGGYNFQGTAGTNIREGNLTLYSDTSQDYRLVVFKGTGNLSVGYTSADLGDKLQVNGSLRVNDAQFATAVTLINSTLATTVIDSFSANAFRTAKYLVQITEGVSGAASAKFHVVEIVVLADNAGNVYKSEYGIIATGGENGTFDVDYNVGFNGLVRLLFTPSNTNQRTIKVMRQCITR